MGFDVELVREMLKNTTNDMQKAIENLLKMQADGSYTDALKEVLKNANIDPNTPSTSSMPSTSQLLNHIQDQEEEMDVSAEFRLNKFLHFFLMLFHRFQAYERFAEDIEHEDNAYLDLPLTEERALLNEYKKMLNM